MIYLSYNTRSDIGFTIDQLSKHNTNLYIRYIKVAKRIICYIKDKIHLRLIYSSHLKNKRNTWEFNALFLFRLISYKDNNYAKDLENKKSVMEYDYFINKAIVSWYSKKQRTVSISITETKYIIFCHMA